MGLWLSTAAPSPRRRVPRKHREPQLHNTDNQSLSNLVSRVHASRLKVRLLGFTGYFPTGGSTPHSKSSGFRLTKAFIQDKFAPCLCFLEQNFTANQVPPTLPGFESKMVGRHAIICAQKQNRSIDVRQQRKANTRGLVSKNYRCTQLHVMFQFFDTWCQSSIRSLTKKEV